MKILKPGFPPKRGTECLAKRTLVANSSLKAHDIAGVFGCGRVLACVVVCSHTCGRVLACVRLRAGMGARACLCAGMYTLVHTFLCSLLTDHVLITLVISKDHKTG